MRFCVFISMQNKKDRGWQQGHHPKQKGKKMTATVIAVLNQKGGAGKTTTAIPLATMLADMGNRVELINQDPQGSSLDWAEARAINRPETISFRMSTMGTSIQQEISSIKAYNDFVIIDGAPQATKLTIAAIKAADIVIIPVQPTQLDTWSTDSIVDFINEIHDMRGKEDPVTFFLPTRVLKGTKVGRSFSDKLSLAYGHPALKSKITQRLAFQEIFEGGGSILDLSPDNPARHEIKMLTKEIIEIAQGIK